MTKYFCDVCGKEVKSITEYIIPDECIKKATSKYGDVLGEFYGVAPKRKEICERCAANIKRFISVYQCLDENDDVVSVKIAR